MEIANRGNVFRVSGPKPWRRRELLRSAVRRADDEALDPPSIHLRLNAANVDAVVERDFEPQEVAIKVKRGTVRGRGANQASYLHAIATHDINFGVGPAGTGKTFLAVAMAVEALEKRACSA